MRTNWVSEFIKFGVIDTDFADNIIVVGLVFSSLNSFLGVGRRRSRSGSRSRSRGSDSGLANGVDEAANLNFLDEDVFFFRLGNVEAEVGEGNL